ncbi:MAG: putative addiction module antidote protein [Holophaga sp.]|nr:putative addiction module antidote protein [Holophaga sp.]
METRKSHTATPRTATIGRAKTTLYDGAAYLKDEKDMAALLEAALEDGDPRVIAAAMGDIARAQGMTKIAKATGLSRESLYRALSPEGNPELDTFIKVVHALGIQLHATTTT